jgi:L-lactate permease
MLSADTSTTIIVAFVSCGLKTPQFTVASHSSFRDTWIEKLDIGFTLMFNILATKSKEASSVGKDVGSPVGWHVG